MTKNRYLYKYIYIIRVTIYECLSIIFTRTVTSARQAMRALLVATQPPQPQVRVTQSMYILPVYNYIYFVYSKYMNISKKLRFQISNLDSIYLINKSSRLNSFITRRSLFGGEIIKMGHFFWQDPEIWIFETLNTILNTQLVMSVRDDE